MDLAATGLDKKGHLIEHKTGKNFRWSNRCMNTSNIAFGSTTHCPELIPLRFLNSLYYSFYLIYECPIKTYEPTESVLVFSESCSR